MPELGPAAMPPQAVGSISQCMRTLRSVRVFRPEPIPPAVLQFILYHATQAGSGKNRQPWRYIVIRQAHRRQQIARWYRLSLGRRRMLADAAGTPHDIEPEQEQAATRLADNIVTAPVLILVCFLPVQRNPANFFGGASIYPAVQNLLLMARAVGLGSILTTVQSVDALTTNLGEAASSCSQLRLLLSIPDDVIPAALIPLGYPRGPFQPTTKRLPVDKVTYAETWGAPWQSNGTAEGITPP